MSLPLFSSSILHPLSYSSSIPHNIVFPARCISFRWLLSLHGSWVSADKGLQNKGTIVPLMSSDFEDESRVTQSEAKEEESYVRPWKSWYTHSRLLRVCEICACSGPVASQENWDAKLLTQLYRTCKFLFSASKNGSKFTFYVRCHVFLLTIFQLENRDKNIFPLFYLLSWSCTFFSL